MMDQAISDDMKPAPPIREHYEKIGGTEWVLEETELDVHTDVALWSDNPRLQATLAVEGVSTDVDLESALRTSKGYDKLRESINKVGQMTPIYVQMTSTGKYLVLEGATRVCVLRELDRKYTTGINQGTFRRIKAKVLPQHFGEKDRVILLAGIHVRGPGVRAWDRYIQAKFVYETVVGSPGNPPIMNQALLAQELGKSASWVNRLKNAYEFALQFVEHIDDEQNGKAVAAKQFSILEEISKTNTIGPQLRDRDNSRFDSLRDDVFEMVRNKVFSEYRDARHLKEFYDDPDKWVQLKSGEEGIAKKLALDVQGNKNSPRAKISSLPDVVRRSIDGGYEEFDDEDIYALEKTIDHISNQVHEGVRPFRVALKKITRTLSEASMADVTELERSELEEFGKALGYFQELVGKYGQAA